MEERVRPKSDYIGTANWRQLYALTEHWKTDLEFYKYELQFLQQLINKYFILLMEDKNINRIRMLVNKLRGMEIVQQNITEGTTLHMSHLIALMKNVSRQKSLIGY